MNELEHLDVSTTTAVRINADLEEFRVILECERARLFDIQIQGRWIDTTRRAESIDLLSSFRSQDERDANVEQDIGQRHSR
jgi:hypothetical protein